MIKTLLPFLLFCSFLLSAGPLAAQVEVVRIDWEISKLAGKNRTPYAPVAQLRADPAVKFTDYLRALVTLSNKSPKAVEGVVLRYVLSLRLLKNGDPAGKAFWCVPYYVEEVRVSKVGAASERQARVIRFELQNQLNKLKNSGFSPTALKLEVMAGPRQGDEPAAIIREAVIEILRP